MKLTGLATLAFTLLAISGVRAETNFAEELLPQCVSCHGDNGVSSIPETPHLGGIDEYYALLQLVAFREGNRKSDIMNGVVADMSNDDLRAAAAWVDGLPRPTVPEEAGDPDKMARGAQLSRANRCNGCHGANLLGGHQMPPLKQQREDYLLKALLDFKSERRIGYRAAMVEVVQLLSEEDLAVLAYYLNRVEETGN